MSTRSNRVEEFRNIVDEVIKRQVDQGRNGAGWPDMDISTRLGDLIFVSVEKGRSRPRIMPSSQEHLWGVVSRKKLKMQRNVGYLAIVSSTDQPENLTRIWSFDSAVGSVPVDTEKDLKKLNELNDAISWIKSPHLANDELDRLGALLASEHEDLACHMEELERKSAEMTENILITEEL